VVAAEAAWADAGSPARDVLQRLFDIIAALALLVLSGPLLLAIAAVNSLASTGPTFYTQERVGRGGRRFRILKFRSMRVDAERATGPVFAREGDARCTVFGGWLRRTCLDELPQLWNVLRGEMSLVGPRPERSLFVEEFRLRMPRYDLRHLVRPGITGWAQVNGWRGCTSMTERLRFDLDYVRRRSLLFDLRILLLTPVAVMFPKRTRRLEAGWNHLVHPGTASAVEADSTAVGDHRARAA
jgi:lipopolysaccharide/colanic/teichoic acid biosynthesis glycosyltransferase